MTDSNYIGDAGESAFDDWARKASFQSAKPIPDRLGIDRWFEMPPSPERRRSGLDQRPPAVRGVVQIKTTTTSRLREPIKLDILERFAKSSQPAFFVRIKIDEEFEVAEAYLLPMDQELISSTLRHLRALTQEASPHTQTVTIVWGDEHRLLEPCHSSFVEHVRAHVGDPTTYAERKKGWNSSAGLGERPYSLNFEYSGNFDALSRWAVGEVADIDVELTAANLTRFDTTLPAPYGPPPGKGKISVEPTPTPARLRLTTDDGVIALSGEVHGLDGRQQLVPQSHRRLRFAHPGFSLSFPLQQPQNVEIRHEGLVRRSVMLSIADAADATDAFSAMLRLETHGRLQFGSQEIHLQGADRKSVDPERASEIQTWGSAFTVLRRLAVCVGIPLSYRVCSQNVLSYQATLAEWGQTFEGPSPSVDIVVEEELRPPVILIRPLWFPFADEVLTQVLVRRCDTPMNADGVCRLSTVAVSEGPLKTRHLQRVDDGRWFVEEVEATYEAIQSEYSDGTIMKGGALIRAWETFCSNI